MRQAQHETIFSNFVNMILAVKEMSYSTLYVHGGFKIDLLSIPK